MPDGGASDCHTGPPTCTPTGAEAERDEGRRGAAGERRPRRADATLHGEWHELHRPRAEPLIRETGTNRTASRTRRRTTRAWSGFTRDQRAGLRENQAPESATNPSLYAMRCQLAEIAHVPDGDMSRNRPSVDGAEAEKDVGEEAVPFGFASGMAALAVVGARSA